MMVFMGVFAVRWTQRLGSRWGELPVKSLAATGLAAYVAVADFQGAPLPAWLQATAWVVPPLFVLGPIAVMSLARGGAFMPAEWIMRILYWGEEAQLGLRRVMAQAALLRGDRDAADRLIPDSAPVLRAQWLAQGRRWEEALEVDVQGSGEQSVIGEGVHAHALMELGRTDEAAVKVDALRRKADQDEDDPLADRVAQLAEARLAAFRGRFDETQRQLQPPPAGVPPHVLFEVLAQAARHARRAGEAELWARAYSAAPEPLRPYYAERLQALGAALPVVKESRPVGTWLMVGLLGLLFTLQNVLDAAAGPLATPVGALTASQWSSAFLLGIQDVTAADAWWRYLSYAFVHGGLLHAGLNAWVLFDIGRLYERRRHWGDLVMSFVFGTAMGSYMTGVAQSGDVVVLLGASGGVLGVAGALFADVLRSRRTSDRALSRSLLQWLLLIGVISVAIPGVSLWGHVGGVIGGLLYGFARQGLPRQRRIPRFAGLLGTTVMAVALGHVVYMAWQLLG